MKRSASLRGLCATAAVALLALAADPAQAAGLTRNPGGASGGGRSGYGGGYRGGGYSGSHPYYRGGHYGHHSHSYWGYGAGYGFWLGAALSPWWWGSLSYPGYFYDPYPYAYSYPPRYYAEPPVVVEPQPQPEAQEGWWYYCQDPQGYYPSVAQCPKGWMRVAPTPESTPEPAPPPAAETQPVEPPAPPPAPQPQETQASTPREYRWYYCQDPPGYYPAVRDCTKGWLGVDPASAPPR